MLSVKRPHFQVAYRRTLTCCLIVLGVITSGVLAACHAHSERFANVKVQFVNSSVGWIVGPRLLRTTNGGHTWAVINQDEVATFKVEDISIASQTIQFISPNIGWILGGGAINKTADGGRTWSTTDITAGQDYSLHSLFFASPEEGWIVGEHVYHTSDGGKSWQRLSKTPEGDPQRQSDMHIAEENANYNPALWFTDTKHGVMARLDGEVYATNDGGGTWKMIWRVDKRILDIFFVNAQDGWIVGSKGFVARTSDGGRTWAPSQTPVKDDTLTSIFFLNKQIGWVAGYDSTILYTKDGGMTRKKASISGLWKRSAPLASVSFTDELHGWAVGGNSDPIFPSLSAPSNVVLTTDDGGQTWRSVQL